MERIKRVSSLAIIFIIGIFVIVNGEKSSTKDTEANVENKKIEQKTTVLASGTKRSKTLYTLEK